MNSMKLEVKIISANNIRKKNVYAKIYIDGEKCIKKKTPVDRRGKKNPKWDYTVAYPINKLDVKDNCTKLVIRVCSEKESNKEYIGEVSVKFNELFKRAGGSWKRKTVMSELKNRSGKSEGNLKFSYRFLEEETSRVTHGSWTTIILKFLPVLCFASSCALA